MQEFCNVHADDIVGTVTSYMKSLPSPFIALYTATRSSDTVCFAYCLLLSFITNQLFGVLNVARL